MDFFLNLSQIACEDDDYNNGRNVRQINISETTRVNYSILLTRLFLKVTFKVSLYSMLLFVYSILTALNLFFLKGLEG